MQQRRQSTPLCPSAHTSAEGARLFGVQVHDANGKRQLAYLPQTEAITDRVMGLAGSAAPHEVLRVAANCIEGRCPHWNGQGCKLATRVATMMPQAVSAMPRCAIRPSCLWFAQEGTAACLRCPQLATIEQQAPDSLVAAVSQLEMRSSNEI